MSFTIMLYCFKVTILKSHPDFLLHQGSHSHQIPINKLQIPQVSLQVISYWWWLSNTQSRNLMIILNCQDSERIITSLLWFPLPQTYSILSKKTELWTRRGVSLYSWETEAEWFTYCKLCTEPGIQGNQQYTFMGKHWLSESQLL